MKNLKRQLITDVQNLDMNSKIEFFNCMVSHNIAFMENSNGVFFSIADISNEILDKLNKKLVMLKKFQNNENDFVKCILKNSDESLQCINESNKKGFEVNTKETKTEKKLDDASKEIFSKSMLNEYNEILKDMENKNNKMNKKHSIYIKYSIAKKKYNKQLGTQDNKKIENFYLNELEEEDYIF